MSVLRLDLDVPSGLATRKATTMPVSETTSAATAPTTAAIPSRSISPQLKERMDREERQRVRDRAAFVREVCRQLEDTCPKCR